MNAPIETIVSAEEVTAEIVNEAAEVSEVTGSDTPRQAREPRLFDAVINPEGRPGIQGRAFAALNHGIKNGPTPHTRALAFTLVNSKNGLVQKMAADKNRQNLRGTAGSTDSYREVVEFIIVKGERGKKDLFTPNFLKLAQAYADAPVEALVSKSPNGRNTPERVAECQAQAREALALAAANLRHNQERGAARKGSAGSRPAAAAATAALAPLA